MGILRRRKQAEYRYQHLGELEPPPGFDTLATVGVGPDGPVGLWSALSRPDVALTSYSAASLAATSVTIVPELAIAFPLVQPMSGGRYLVVGARCAWTEATVEQNAVIVSADGSIELRGTLGDGINHVNVDQRDDIWVAYSDEGIYGNYGWGGPGPEPLGSPGVVRWSSAFEKQWEYPQEGEVTIDDCYALNVSDAGVWVCPYVDFPVLNISDGDVRVHTTAEVEGPNGLIVSDDVVGLIGDYESPGALLIGRLNVDGPTRLRGSAIAMPDGSPVPTETLHCRGGTAHLFIDADWFTFSLSDTHES